MKKFWIQFVLLVVVILAGTYITFNPSLYTSYFGASTSGENLKKQLKVGETVVDIEIADSAEKRRLGLSNRDLLPENSGMLFVFETDKKYRFWMKDMKIPLDFIFIRDGKVVDHLLDIKPPLVSIPDSNLPVYEPVTEIDMLLEVNSGFINSKNIKVGDTVSLVE